MADLHIGPTYTAVADRLSGLTLSESYTVAKRLKLVRQGLDTPCIIVAPGPLATEAVGNNAFRYRVGVVIAMIRAGGEQRLNLDVSTDDEFEDATKIIEAFQDERLDVAGKNSDPCSFDALDPATDAMYRAQLDGQFFLLTVPTRHFRS